MCVYFESDIMVWREGDRCARKTHRCGECNRTITAGERYRYAFAIDEDGAREHKTCAGCALALDWLVANCGGYLFHDAFDELRSHFDGDEAGIWSGEYVPEYSSPGWRPTQSRLWLGRVLVGMRRKWQGIDLPLATVLA